MQCPACQAVVKKGSNFCRHCGHQMPVIVGVSFPFGIRFPSGSGKMFASAVNHARAAPRYFEETIEGVRFHVALYDRPTVPDLAALYRTVFFSTYKGDSPVLIEHTTDGRTFFSGPSFWGCLARRLTDDCTEHPEVPHPSCRCHSFFGCLAAQRRQHEMYHREGWEVFYNGRHGIFPGGDGPEFEALRNSGRDLVSLGDLDRSTFLLDREKVRLETLNLIRRAGAHRCPLFLPVHFEAQVKKLPKLILIGETPGWRFLNCTIHGPAVAWECYGTATTIEGEST